MCRGGLNIGIRRGVSAEAEAAARAVRPARRGAYSGIGRRVARRWECAAWRRNVANRPAGDNEASANLISGSRTHRSTAPAIEGGASLAIANAESGDGKQSASAFVKRLPSALDEMKATHIPRPDIAYSR